MKKFFLLITFVLTMVIGAQAQVCKIKGSTANDNVEVYSYVLINNNSAVNVTVGNDSQNTSANVTVTVEVTYTDNSSLKFSAKGLAKPNGPTDIVIPIKDNNGGFTKVKKVEVISITGTKCEE